MDILTILSLGQTALELGLICSLTVLALFLSYTMLNVCDLSTDGCFTLGAAVGAAVAIAGHPWLSLGAAMIAGICSGFIVAILQTRMGVNSLLAGIIVNTALYSINIAVMGGSSLQTAVIPETPRFLSSQRITRAKGQTLVFDISVTLMRVGSVLLPVPITLIRGIFLLYACSAKKSFAVTLSTASIITPNFSKGITLSGVINSQTGIILHSGLIFLYLAAAISVLFLPTVELSAISWRFMLLFATVSLS